MTWRIKNKTKNYQVGQKFYRWTIIKTYANQKKRASFYLCVCDCGTKQRVLDRTLRYSYSKSCGCLSAEMAADRLKKQNTIHGMTGSPEFHAWQAMRFRCENKKYSLFHRYGGRGIKVCKRWEKFENFYKDMGPRPKNKQSLDRINSDGNYEPGNCRWANWREQQNNRKNNRMLSYNGKTQTMAQWSKEVGIGARTIWYRLSKGYSIKDALTKPVRGSSN